MRSATASGTIDSHSAVTERDLLENVAAEDAEILRAIVVQRNKAPAHGEIVVERS